MISKKYHKKYYKKAFSLIELSIVIILVAVVFSSAIAVYTASINNQKIKKTNQNFEEIYRAIGAFLLANKRLPCPASISKNFISDADYGTEVIGCSGNGLYQSNSSSNIIYGAVPFKALNISLGSTQDGFGSAIAYAIDKRFAVANDAQLNFNNITFATAPSSNNIIIKDKLISGETILTADAIMVLISYGMNKSGSFDSQNSNQLTRSSDVNEMENDLTNLVISNPSTANFDNIFINQVRANLIFDDLIFYKTKKDLIEDFEAQHLTACYDAGQFFANANAYFNQIIYANRGCWYPVERKRLTRKCLANGVWQEYSPCTFCTIATISGVNQIDVNIGSGNLTCNQAGRSGTISYQCFIDGSFTTSGGCS
jgi:prepilin-type N-terminal cleavage/methylation domain-containing protein